MKQGWERKWVVLSDMKLSIYENENTEGEIILFMRLKFASVCARLS